MSCQSLLWGEIIWVVVSGTAVVSERGPGRVFGDQKGLDYYPRFFRTVMGCAVCPQGVSAYERLGHSVLIYSIWLWERIIISLQHLGHVSPGIVGRVQLSTLGGRRIRGLDWI